jgi:valyl-tRNA synthetase
VVRSAGDRPSDRARVEKELAGARQALAQTEQRLADPAFTERAPAHVVEQARARATELRDLVARLSARVSP